MAHTNNEVKGFFSVYTCLSVRLFIFPVKIEQVGNRYSDKCKYNVLNFESEQRRNHCVEASQHRRSCDDECVNDRLNMDMFS